jgi:hypothetical protein
MFEFARIFVLGWVTVWIKPHTGEQIYIQWCRQTPSCEEHITWATRAVIESAMKIGLDELEALALAIKESKGLNPWGKSSIGAFGFLQLHPQSTTGIAARKACRGLSQRECDLVTLDMAMRLFKQVREQCGTFARAVYAWRTGECGRSGPNRVNAHENQVIKLYQRLVREYEQYRTRT